MQLKRKRIAFFFKEYRYIRQYFSEIVDGLLFEYDVVVFHFSKIRNSVVNSEPNIDEVDLSGFSHGQVSKAISKYSPEACIITNFRSLCDLYMLETLRAQGCKTVYMEHGLILSKATSFKANNRKQALLEYANYMLKVAGLLSKSFSFGKFYRALTKSRYEEFTLSFAILYAKKSTAVLAKIGLLDKTEIHFSGYPVCKNEEDLSRLKAIKSEKNIVYIHQPLIADGYSSLSFEQEFRIIKELDERARLAGYEFILKLHPRDKKAQYQDGLAGVKISDEKDTNRLIAQASFVIGHFSTALLTAVVLDRPLLILDNKDLKIDSQQVFEEIGTPISNMNMFSEFLGKTQSGDGESAHFIDSIIGCNNTHEARIGVLKNILIKNV